jgi:hypothetical protein
VFEMGVPCEHQRQRGAVIPRGFYEPFQSQERLRVELMGIVDGTVNLSGTLKSGTFRR